VIALESQNCSECWRDIALLGAMVEPCRANSEFAVNDGWHWKGYCILTMLRDY
jgi:hypothetical protein